MTNEELYELTKKWRKSSTIEDDIAAVYSKHQEMDGFESHLSAARAYRQCACDLEQKLKASSALPAIGGGLPRGLTGVAIP